MAQRRMFSLKVIDTDRFIEMPASARLLYFDLSMRADDDGFVNSPKKIIKFTGASTDDFKILCAKQYIILFSTGVCVIRDWRIHNFIRQDRYNETINKAEKKELTLDNTGSYNINGKNVIPNVIPDGAKGVTQVRLGKDRKGKINKDITPFEKLKKELFKKTKAFFCENEDSRDIFSPGNPAAQKKVFQVETPKMKELINLVFEETPKNPSLDDCLKILNKYVCGFRDMIHDKKHFLYGKLQFKPSHLMSNGVFPYLLKYIKEH
jgi:hypothetical protein